MRVGDADRGRAVAKLLHQLHAEVLQVILARVEQREEPRARAFVSIRIRSDGGGRVWCGGNRKGRGSGRGIDTDPCGRAWGPVRVPKKSARDTRSIYLTPYKT